MPNTDIKKYFKNSILFLICGLSIVLHAQSETTQVSRLVEQLKELPLKSEAYVDTLNELAYQLIGIDLEKADNYATQAYELAKEIDYELGFYDSHIQRGIICEKRGDFSGANNYYEPALKFRVKNKMFTKAANVCSNIGLCYVYQGQFEAAINYYKKGLSYLKNEAISESHGHIYGNIAEAFTWSGNYNAAVTYVDSSLQIWDALNDKNGRARTLIAQGGLFYELNKFEKAKVSYLDALDTYAEINNSQGKAAVYVGLGDLQFAHKNYDEALVQYKKAMDYRQALGVVDQSYILYNTGIIKADMGELDEALQKFTTSKALFESIEDTWSLAEVHFEMGKIFKVKKNYPEAIRLFQESLKNCEENCDLYTKAKINLQLSEASIRTGDKDLAYESSRSYGLLMDSLENIRLSALNSELAIEEIKHENQKLILEKDKLLLMSKNQNLWYRSLAIGGALGSLLLLFIFRSYRNQQLRRLSEYQTEQAYMEIDDILRNQELEITYAQLEAKDETQKQIGQDLHDRLGMMLSTIKLYFNEFSDLLGAVKTDTSHKQHKTIELLDEAVKEVRRISQDMQSGILKKFGLASAVKDLADTIRQSNQLDVEVKVHGLKERIPNTMEFKIYKIIQELISNVLKHARAKKMTIYLHQQNELFNLIVEDDGIGFQKDQVMEKGGMGLKNITLRVTELNGTCHFDSTISNGTSVIIDIPI